MNGPTLLGQALTTSLAAALLAACFANPTPHPNTADTVATSADTGSQGAADAASAPDGTTSLSDTTGAFDVSPGPEILEPSADAGAAIDAAADAALDAGVDAAADVGADVAMDVPADVPMDVPADVPMDAPADAVPDTVPDGGGDVDGDATADGPPLFVGPWSAEELGGDGVWNPGETITVTVTLNSHEDFTNYPGAVLEDDQDLVTYAPAQFDFFAIFADQPMDASWQVTADASMSAGAVVQFTSYASTLSCGQGNGLCPPYQPITFSLTLGEPLPATP